MREIRKPSFIQRISERVPYDMEMDDFIAYIAEHETGHESDEARQYVANKVRQKMLRRVLRR